MRYPLVAYSWTAMSPYTIFKRMDKSTFIHRGAGIAKQISWFFNIPDGDMLSPLHISLQLDGKTYDVRIEMDVVHSRYRLFWLSDFSQEIQNRFPDHYNAFNNGESIGEGCSPIMRLDRIDNNRYSVSWEAPDGVSLYQVGSGIVS